MKMQIEDKRKERKRLCKEIVLTANAVSNDNVHTTDMLKGIRQLREMSNELFNPYGKVN